MRRPAIPTAQPFPVPAPTGGLNTVASGLAMPPEDASLLYNLVSGESGLKVRSGYREWSTGLGTAVRTMLPFVGAAGSGGDNKLFAATADGIWDVTANPAVLVFPFPDTSGDAGRGVWHAFTTSGGHFLLYCDEVNGYHIYSATSGLWTQPAMGGGAGEVDNVAPADLVFVMVWKSRLWFVERDSNNAWYLPAGNITGAAAKLNLDRSAQFRQGGGLVGLWNWTLDGGIGIDDHLVAISHGGDVAIYQGTDPASAGTFSLKGTWNAGAVVSGRNIASNFGGDVLIITQSGLRPLSQLVAGGDGMGTYATGKIANLFSELAQERGELPGWGIHIHPKDNVLLVTVPTEEGEPTEQLAMSLWNRSWSRYRDLPISAACVWDKKLYLGDTDGAVHVTDGYVDGITLADPFAFTPIQWGGITAFKAAGARGVQLQTIRTTILSQSTRPPHRVAARYNFDMTEVGDVSAEGGPNSWDVGEWDEATWSTDSTLTQRLWGATGTGFSAAIAFAGISVNRTVLVGFDVSATLGGIL